jgi:porphobilinogen deaminase
LGALAREKDGRIELVAIVTAPDGSREARAAIRAETPREAADAAYRQLVDAGAKDILAQL